MPRTYKRTPGSRKYVDYTSTQLEEILRKVKCQEITQRQAAKQYKIPRSTLKRKLKGESLRKPGGQPLIDSNTEEKFKDYIIACSLFGFPLDAFDVRILVKTHLDRNGTRVRAFKNNMPGIDWFKSFMSRHPDLTERMSANIKKQRAKVSAEVLNEYFDFLDNEIAGVPPSHIYNFDETNLVDDPGKKKIITKRGLKYPERILNTSKSATSIMMCGNAEGNTIPPYVVYKSKDLWSSWTEGGPPGCRYNRSMSGWFDSQSFDDWFHSLVLPHLKRQEGLKVLIGDNLSSHLNVNIIETCRTNNIKFICLPPNSTHLTQPLDLAFFRPMKELWRKILLEYKVKTGKSPVAMSDFAKLLKELVSELKKNTSSLINGFRKAGIYPQDRSEVIRRLPSKDNLSSSSNDDTAELDSRISDSVLQFLHSKRYGEGNANNPSRKKKVNVQAGKSVATEDFLPTSTSEALKIPDRSLADKPSTSTSGALVRSLADKPSTSTSGALVRKEKKGDIKKKSKVVISDSETPESDFSIYSEFEYESFDEDFFETLKKRARKEQKNKGTGNAQKEPSEVVKKVATENDVLGGNILGQITFGTYVIVIYEGEYFPGVVEELDGQGEYKISTLTMSGIGWKWPEQKDCCWYKKGDIVEKIHPPNPINARGTFAVPEIGKWQKKENI